MKIELNGKLKGNYNVNNRFDYMGCDLMFSSYPDVIGVEEISIMLGGISKKLVYRLLDEGEIFSFKVGREWKSTKIDVIEYIYRQRYKNSK